MLFLLISFQGKIYIPIPGNKQSKPYLQKGYKAEKRLHFVPNSDIRTIKTQLINTRMSSLTCFYNQ